MKLNNFDEELEIALREYVQNTEITANEKVKFSKKHKQKMNKLFEDVKNYDFEKIAASDTKGNAYQFNVRKFARVAVFIILALLITIMVTPSMVAWRKEELGLYGGESGEYSWILPDDITGILENNPDDKMKYMKIFGYATEEYEIQEISSMAVSQYLKINVNDRNFFLRIYKDINQAIDVEEIMQKKLNINNIEILFLEKENFYSFVWEYNDRAFRLYGNLDFDEMVKIIENINYEEIEKVF